MSMNFRRIDFGKIWKWVLVSYWIRKKNARVVLNFSQKLLEQSESSILIESDRRYLVSDWTQRADWWFFSVSKFFISYRIRIYQLSKSTFTKIQLSQQFALQWWTKSHNLSPVNSSLCSENQKKDAQQVKSPMSRKEERSCLLFSKNDKRRTLVSANLIYEQKKSKEQFKSQEMIKEWSSCLLLQIWAKIEQVIKNPAISCLQIIQWVT